MFVPRRSHPYRVCLLYVVASFLVLTTVTPAVEAGADTKAVTKQTPRTKSDVEFDTADRKRSEDFQTVRQALNREQVREKLSDLGFTEENIQDRLDRLSDRDLHRMAERIHHLKAGGAEVDESVDMRWGMVSRAMLLVIFSPMAAITFPLLIVYYFLFAVGPKRK